MEHEITTQVQLSDEQAWALAQLFKRIGYTDCRALAQDEEEAWLMLQAIERVRGELALVGYAPR